MGITNTMWIWLHHNNKMCLNTRWRWHSFYTHCHFWDQALWCRDTSSPQGGAIIQEMISGPPHLLTHFSLPSLCPPLRQVTCWASSTPLQRKSSATKAPTSSSSAGVSWRPLIGWEPPSRTERQAGRLTPRNWAALTNSCIITWNLRSQFLW